MPLQQIKKRTRRKTALKPLRARTEADRQLLASLRVLERIADPVMIYDIRGTVSGANAAARTCLGFDPAGMTQAAVISRLSSRLPTGEKVKKKNLISAWALAGESIRDQEYHFTDSSGGERTVIASADPIKNAGKIIGAMVLWHDVSEQRHLQRELESLSRFPLENPNPILRADGRGTILYRNPSAARAFGRLHCEAGRPLPAGLRKLARQARQTGRVVKGEVSSKTRVFHVAVVPIRQNDYVNIYGLDITERKRAVEEIVRFSKEMEARVKERTEEIASERQRLYSLLETLPVYVILLDQDHRVPFANKFFRERFGESHGRRCYEYLFNRDAPCEVCDTYEVLKTGANQRWEWTGPDGRIYDIYDYPFVEADGSLLILEMGIDITEQKRAEESLRSASQYARSLIEASLDPLITISPRGKISDVNEAMIKATGLSRQDLIGADFSRFFTEPAKARAGYRQVFAQGLVRDYPLTVRHKDGRLTDVIYNAAVYKDPRGNVLGVFAAARDVTARRETERKLARIQAEMAETKRLSSLGAIAATVAHELRTPLGTIGLAAANLKRKTQDPTLNGQIEKIQRKVEESDRIISNLLTYTRIRMPQYEAVRLDRVVAEALKTVRERYPRAKVRVMRNLAALAKTAVEADRVQLLEIFNNIVTNAYQAIDKPAGRVQVSGRIAKGASAVVTVRDNGEGIDKEAISRVFEPFYSGKRTGTGLGLSLSKELIELHGGSIKITSQKGAGTVVTIALPLRRDV